MDFISVFKNELFRPFAVLLIPGFVAATPLVLFFSNYNPELHALFDKQPAVFFGGYLAVITAFGLLLENLGTAIERGIDDCLEAHHMPDHSTIWQKYLTLKRNTDIVGHHFIGSMVVRMKFANSMIPALFALLMGIWLLHFTLDRWTLWTMLATTLVIMTVAGALFRQTIGFSEALSNIRYFVIEGSGETVLESQATAAPKSRMFAKYVLWHLRGYRSDDLSTLDESAKSWFVRPKPAQGEAQQLASDAWLTDPAPGSKSSE